MIVNGRYTYTVYIRCFWQGFNQIYNHIRCICTVLANPILYHIYKSFLCADVSGSQHCVPKVFVICDIALTVRLAVYHIRRGVAPAWYVV